MDTEPYPVPHLVKAGVLVRVIVTNAVRVRFNAIINLWLWLVRVKSVLGYSEVQPRFRLPFAHVL